MSSILDKITESNWKELAAKVAQEIFPKGTLVDWYYAGIEFGIVSSISETGKITIQKGKLPLEKVTDNNPTYGKFWYRANLEEFKPYTKEDLEMYGDKKTTRFNPRYFHGSDWKKNGCDSPIGWHQTIGNRLLSIGKPKITKNGLIMEEHYFP